MGLKLRSSSKKLRGLGVRAQARRIRTFLYSRDEARRVEVQCRVSVRGGALSLVLIVQATAEEVNRLYYKPRHKAGLRWSGALLQGPAVEWS